MQMQLAETNKYKGGFYDTIRSRNRNGIYHSGHRNE